MQTNLFSNGMAAGCVPNSRLEGFVPNFSGTVFGSNPQAADPVALADRDRHHRQGNISDPSFLPDRDLYQLCQEYGANARLWSRKFASLLPEVARRRLYKRHGFYSIYEFAGKLAGMSHKTVDEVLRIYRRVEGKPLLTKQIEKFGWAKVRAVASLAGEVEERNLVEMVENLPKQALEECVRGLKRQAAEEGQPASRTETLKSKNQSLSLSPPPGWGRIASQTGMLCELGEEREENSGDEELKRWPTLSLSVSPETEFHFRKLQHKLEKDRKQKVSFGEVLKALLDLEQKEKSQESAFQVQNQETSGKSKPRVEGKKKSQKKVEQGPGKENNTRNKTFENFKKSQNSLKSAPGHEAPKGHQPPRRNSEIAKGQQEAITKPSTKNPSAKVSTTETSSQNTYIAKPASRHIPAATKQTTIQKHNHQCAFPGCNKPYEVLHHPERFALKKSHQKIVPLCNSHHQIAHAGLIKNEERLVEEWG